MSKLAALGAFTCLLATVQLPSDAVGQTNSPDDMAQVRAIAISKQARFQAPDGWTWRVLVNADGAHLRYGWTTPPGRLRGVIVVAPSFQAPAEEYFEMARDFRSHGYAVWILDRRGQGASDRWPGAEARAHLEGAEREVRDLRQFSNLAFTTSQDAPHFLIGESFGGLIGLRLLHDSPELFTAAAFSSPGIDFQTNGVPREVLKNAVVSACDAGRCKEYAPTQKDWAFDPNPGATSDAVRDDAERGFAEEGVLLMEPKLREGGATNGFVTTLFEEADREEAPGWPEKVSVPTLFGYTPKDRISRPDVMQAVCRRMPHCELMRFDSSGHALFTDSDTTREPWMKKILLFFNNRPSASR